MFPGAAAPSSCGAGEMLWQAECKGIVQVDQNGAEAAPRTMRRRPEAEDNMLGARIRHMRLQRGVTQTELARRVGVTFQQIQKYERGTNRLTATMLARIASVLDVPCDVLVAGLFGNPAEGSLAATVATDPFSFAEGLSLLHTFARVREADQRYQVLKLVEAMAEASSGASEEAPRSSGHILGAKGRTEPRQRVRRTLKAKPLQEAYPV